MTFIHSHNDLVKKYYDEFSDKRYHNTQDNYLAILLPFKKNYINSTVASKSLNYIDSLLISDIIQETLKLNRIDILSYYQDHNYTPSVRSFHSTYFIIIICNIGYYYNIYDNTLSIISKPLPQNFELDINKIYILVISDILNLSRYYGDFSIYPSLLESGHLLENILNVLNKHQINSCLTPAPPNLMNYLNIDSRYNYIQYMIMLDLKNGVNDILDETFQIIYDERFAFDYNEFQDSKYLKDLIGYFNENPIISHKEFILEDYKKYIWNRNSGHNTIGNFNIRNSFSAFNPEKAIENIKSQNNLSSNINIYILEIQKNKLVIYSDSKERFSKNTSTNNILTNNQQFLDLSTFKYIVILTSPKNIDNIRENLICCGQIMQRFSLYIAQLNYSFRPMKNHNDANIKDILNLNDAHNINYIGVLCDSEPLQIHFEI